MAKPGPKPQIKKGHVGLMPEDWAWLDRQGKRSVVMRLILLDLRRTEAIIPGFVDALSNGVGAVWQLFQHHYQPAIDWIQSMRNQPSTGGSTASIEEAAKAVPGVSKAVCFWPTGWHNGEALLMVGDERGEASPALIRQVAKAIDQARPAGVQVDVRALMESLAVFHR